MVTNGIDRWVTEDSCNPGTYYGCGSVSVLRCEGDGDGWRDKDRGGGGHPRVNGSRMRLRPRRFVCTW
jgi:hypothetical protein